MAQLSVCILTFNSMRTLPACLAPAQKVADQLVVVDSGSQDGTLEFLRSQGVEPVYRKYESHGSQMNFALGLASSDWVLCLDSDEFMDDTLQTAILKLKASLADDRVAYRIPRYWQVLGQDVRAIYPVSSPDFPLRLFNRRRVRFNDVPVDDKATGAPDRRVLPGRLSHDTFFSLHEVFAKLNDYTSRLVGHQHIKPSLSRALLAPIFAFGKWYVWKGGWRDGAVGVVTGIYAAQYTFLKYFKAWCRSRRMPLK